MKRIITMPLKLTKTGAIRAQSTSAEASTAEVSTFQFQDQLPKLPVPPLEATAKKYLRSIEPFVLPDKYRETERIVHEFVKPGGVGQTLQARLQDRASKHKNWMYEWWNESAYMGYRDPVVPYVSYFYSYKDQLAKYPHPAGRAAAIVTHALEFKSQLDNETLPPDYMRKKPIDMELFNFMFNTCRVPAPVKDQCASYPSAGNEHIVVLRRNRFYKLPYIVNGRQLSTGEIEYQLTKIYEDAELRGQAPNVGGLTSWNRDKWTAARERLVGAAPVNAESLEVVQSAAFVLCLDWAAPSSDIERTHAYWHGHCRNRFYDKPLQLIVNDNGTAGFMGEHSMMDGMHTLRFNEFILERLFNQAPEIGAVEGPKLFEEIPFVVTDTVQNDIAEAKHDFRREILKHEVAVWQFNEYGKETIKKFKVSPDAFVQMLFQLAYYRMHGRVRPVYEAATTRKFAQGRTETTRSASVESADLCSKFWEPNVSDEAKIAAFRSAVAAQTAYVADAAEGHGVDRHLFGLKRSLLPGEPLPEIFSDPAFSYSSTWFLSTSQLSSEYLNGYGWSQVVPDGFGLAYMINKNDIHVNICSQYMGSNRIMEYLDDAAIKLAKLLGTEPTRKSSHL